MFFNINDIISKNNAFDFKLKALELFNFQYQNNQIYQKWCNCFGKNPENISELHEIPFLPIEFFKNSIVSCLNINHSLVFYSSGTSDMNNRSKHYIYRQDLYKTNAVNIFEYSFGPLKDIVLLLFLPSYQENPNSSLVFMMDTFLESAHPESKYVKSLIELKVLIEKHRNLNVLVWGVSYGLMDFAEKYPDNYSEIRFIETGGMKGRRKELLKEEMHSYLTNQLNVSKIFSEYGMTELLSQAYSLGDGIFEVPNTMHFFVREVSDPLTVLKKGRGGLNIIDLANVDSCAFIATQDLGEILNEKQFKVLGRIDNSDARGCNMMYVG